MKKIILGLAGLFLLTHATHAQITIGNSNMPGSNDTLRYSNAQLSSIGNYTQTGTNFNWNYSSLIPISQGVRAYKAAILTPYAFFFLGFNEYGEKVNDTVNLGIVTLTDIYNFYKKNTSPNCYQIDGTGMKISGIPVPSYYTDKDELYMFPMTYPKYDSTTFRFSTPSTTLIPFVYTKTGYRVTKVDGWGTITTPYGTASCLRLVTTQYAKDSIKTSIFPFGFNNYQRSYQWLTTSSKIPYLEVNGTLNGNTFTVTQIRFRDIYRFLLNTGNELTDENLAIYPNPVQDKLNFNFRKNSKYNVSVYDMNGKEVLNLNSDEFMNSNGILNVEKLPQGVYILKATENEKPVTFKFIKE